MSGGQGSRSPNHRMSPPAVMISPPKIRIHQRPELSPPASEPSVATVVVVVDVVVEVVVLEVVLLEVVLLVVLGGVTWSRAQSCSSAVTSIVREKTSSPPCSSDQSYNP